MFKTLSYGTSYTCVCVYRGEVCVYVCLNCRISGGSHV